MQDEIVLSRDDGDDLILHQTGLSVKRMLTLPAAQSDPKLALAIKESAVRRQAMIKRFGFVPTSVLNITRGALSNKMFNYQRESPSRKSELQGNAVKKLQRLQALGISNSASQRHAGRGGAGISMMAAELVDFFIKYYAKPEGTFLDPFMGQGIRMQVAHRHGLTYYGYDLSADFMAYNRAVVGKLDNTRTKLHITEGDSRWPTAIPDAIGDFGFTSPPYFDLEWYGDEDGQLGRKGATYAEFLTGLELVAKNWLPKFKPDATFVVNVNDFRKNGVFYSYHSDTIALFRRAGWYLHDICIIHGLVGGMARSFAVDFNRKGIMPKLHEYGLIFKPTPSAVDEFFDDDDGLDG